MCAEDMATPSTSSSSRYASEPLSQRPLASIGFRSRPAPSIVDGRHMNVSWDHPEEIDSQATIQQKMLQQRQRTLSQKQRVASSSLVTANENLPPSEAYVAGSPGCPETGGRRSWNAAVLDPVDQQPYTGCARIVPPRTPGMSSMGAMMMDSPNLSMASMALSDRDTSAIIVPDMIHADSKEEDARRRSCLAQELDERGISPVFDPTAVTGAAGDANFDISNIKPTDLKSFLLNPSPKHAGLIECRIVRERSGLNKLFPRYVMESDAGVFLLSARKQKHNKTSNYWISMSQEDVGKDDEAFLGKLRSNFFGLEFASYGTGLNPKKIDRSMPQVHAIQLARPELVAVHYSSSLWGSKPRGPRKMCAVIPRVQPKGERQVCRTLHPETDGLSALLKSGTANHLIDTYQNKPPKWNEQIGAFVLNFNKRVTQASVKNFQLTTSEDPDTVYLQFGRVGKDVFNMDFRYPFSPLQAFAICLSSFDYKLCCE